MGRTVLKLSALAAAMASFGFHRHDRTWLKGGFSFFRPSDQLPVHEHIRVFATNPVYAEVVISAASFASCHACVSVRHNHLRELLADNEYGTSSLDSVADGRTWQSRLIDNADSSAKQAFAEFGPALIDRLSSHLKAVEQYISHTGSLVPIFDREFAFLNEATQQEQSEVERIATRANSMLYLRTDDSQLASLILTRFGPTIEPSADFSQMVPQRDQDLAIRLILLCDHIQRSRQSYAATTA